MCRVVSVFNSGVLLPAILGHCNLYLPPSLPPSLFPAVIPSCPVLSCPVRNTLACLPSVFLQSMLDMIAVALRDNELQAKAEERRKKREAAEKKRQDLEKSVLGGFVC